MPGTLCSQKPYQNMGGPNVGLLPTPAGPVPTPSVSTSMGPTRVPTNLKVLDTVMPFHTMRCKKPVSMGCVGPGVVSGTAMAQVQALVPHLRISFAASPGQSFLSPHGQNGPGAFNCPGTVATPPANRFISLSG